MRGPCLGQAVRAVHGPGAPERFVGELPQVAVRSRGRTRRGRRGDSTPHPRSWSAAGASTAPAGSAILSSPHRRAGWRSGCSAPSERAEAGQRGPAQAPPLPARRMTCPARASRRYPTPAAPGSAFAAPGAGGCWCCCIADAVARPPALGLSDDAAQQRRDLDAAEAQRLAAVAFPPPAPGPTIPEARTGDTSRRPGQTLPHVAERPRRSRRDSSPASGDLRPALSPSSLTSGSFSPQCSSAASTPLVLFPARNQPDEPTE